MGPIRWLALQGLPEADRVVGQAVYDVLNGGFTKATQALEVLHREDDDRVRKVINRLLDRNPGLSEKVEYEPELRLYFEDPTESARA